MLLRTQDSGFLPRVLRSPRGHSPKVHRPSRPRTTDEWHASCCDWEWRHRGFGCVTRCCRSFCPFAIAHPPRFHPSLCFGFHRSNPIGFPMNAPLPRMGLHDTFQQILRVCPYQMDPWVPIKRRNRPEGSARLPTPSSERVASQRLFHGGVRRDGIDAGAGSCGGRDGMEVRGPEASDA